MFLLTFYSLTSNIYFSRKHFFPISHNLSKFVDEHRMVPKEVLRSENNKYRIPELERELLLDCAGITSTIDDTDCWG